MAIRRSLGFSALTQLINFLLSFGSVIIVSRLLTPEEIGIFSVSVSLLGFAHILRDFGVGNYLIQVKEVTRANMRAAFSVMLYSSWLIAALLFLARGPIADFYNREGVAEVIGLIAFNFLIIPFGAPILSVLRREMQFGRITIVSTANTFVQVSVTVICAMNGLSYLSMAWGSIAGMATNVNPCSMDNGPMPAAHGGAIDRGDDRERTGELCADHGFEHDVLGRPGLVRHAVPLLEVRPGAEEPPRPGQHRHPHGPILRQRAP